MLLCERSTENFNGETAPHELANAMSISPTSSAWQSLTGAAVAYGLTEGGYNATTISLTPLGSRIVAPEDEGDDGNAIREAALLPRIFKQFFQKYDRGKFPQETIGINVLASMGAPRDRAKPVYEMARATGLLAGFITNTKTGLYVALKGGTTPARATNNRRAGRAASGRGRGFASANTGDFAARREDQQQGLYYARKEPIDCRTIKRNSKVREIRASGCRRARDTI